MILSGEPLNVPHLALQSNAIRPRRRFSARRPVSTSLSDSIRQQEPQRKHLKEFRATIDHLWRRANGPAPAYKQLNALNAIVREMFAPNDRAAPFQSQPCPRTDTGTRGLSFQCTNQKHRSVP